jgi:hypothetical protein
MEKLRVRIPVTIIRPDGTRIEYMSGIDAARAERIAPNWVTQMCKTGCQHRGFKAEYTQAKH